jgi:TfoX N-terminal domain
MAFDEGLAQRIRDLVQARRGITERRMFGGLAFMSGGHMFVGVLEHTLMARVGPTEYAGALARRHVREMDFTGKPMKGYVYVDASGLEEESDLKYWIDTCLHNVDTLPPKAPKGARPSILR